MHASGTMRQRPISFAKHTGQPHSRLTKLCWVSKNSQEFHRHIF